MATGQGMNPTAASVVQVKLQGSIQTELIPRAAVDHFLAKHDELARAKGMTIFFGGAALSTVPALAVAEPAGWLVGLLAAEALITAAAGTKWRGQRREVRKARDAMRSGGGGVVVATTTYNQVNTFDPTVPSDELPPGTVVSEP